jgi:hypothetical protein
MIEESNRRVRVAAFAVICLAALGLGIGTLVLARRDQDRRAESAAPVAMAALTRPRCSRTFRR